MKQILLADVYAGDTYVGAIQSNTLESLKAKASKLCSSYNTAQDRMEVYKPSDDHAVTFWRINRKCPNNTNIRGSWK